MLTKTHFQAIAQTINGLYAEALLSQVEHRTVAEHFADMCQRENPRFDRQRFLTACGVAP